jgi:protein-disulfide isomerase-like protein with CxxC motif
MRRRTQQHFLHTRQAGVRGFPALIVSDASGPTRLGEGCRPLREIRSALDAWLDKHGEE